eukprot:1990184-Amphidinium_carterae.3
MSEQGAPAPYMTGYPQGEATQLACGNAGEESGKFGKLLLATPCDHATTHSFDHCVRLRIYDLRMSLCGLSRVCFGFWRRYFVPGLAFCGCMASYTCSVTSMFVGSLGGMLSWFGKHVGGCGGILQICL